MHISMPGSVWLFQLGPKWQIPALALLAQLHLKGAVTWLDLVMLATLVNALAGSCEEGRRKWRSTHPSYGFQPPLNQSGNSELPGIKHSALHSSSSLGLFAVGWTLVETSICTGPEPDSKHCGESITTLSIRAAVRQNRRSQKYRDKILLPTHYK